MIIVLLANGFEEIEALTPVDILRREGYEVKTVGISGRSVVGSHNITVIADALPEEINLSDVEMAVFPGGMPGSLNLDGSDFTDKVINAVLSRGGHLAAICAAPLVLGRRGLLKGKRVTCFPGFEGELIGAEIVNRDAVTDGNITTGRGMTVSLEFARELTRVLKLRVEDPDRLNNPYAECFDDVAFVGALELCSEVEELSASVLQRRLSIGYGKAAKFMDALAEFGIIARDGRARRVIADGNALIELIEKAKK